MLEKLYEEIRCIMISENLLFVEQAVWTLTRLKVNPKLIKKNLLFKNFVFFKNMVFFNEHVFKRVFFKNVFLKILSNLIYFDPIWSRIIQTLQLYINFYKPWSQRTTKKLLGLSEQSSQSKKQEFWPKIIVNFNDHPNLSAGVFNEK